MNELIKIDSLDSCVLQNSQISVLITNFKEAKKYYLHWKRHKDSIVFKSAKSAYDIMSQKLKSAINDVNISDFNKKKIIKLVK